MNDSETLTTNSLIVNGFQQGNTLDYVAASGLTAHGSQQESLVSFTPGGTIVDTGTATVDGFTVVGIEAPVVETVQDAAGTASTIKANLGFLLVPGPSPDPFAISDLHLTGDGEHGVDIFSTQPCFRASTRIRTPDGDVAIEHLRPGDLVLTVRGGAPVPRKVAWIGHRGVDCAAHPRPADAMPVRVQAHAFGPGRPQRDLWLSPDHAVFAGGVLIPVRYLINGASVAQQYVERVTYYHLELPRHDLVLAEGLPAESYLDTGNRAAFANGGPVAQLAADFAYRAWDVAACAPLATAGPAVARVRKRLLARLPALGHALTLDPQPHFVCDGTPAEASRSGADLWSVALPPGARMLRLRSRAARPADFDPTSDDTRRLGVALLALRLDGREISLADPTLCCGWHASEGGLRWTGGDAEIEVAGAKVAELRLVSWLSYLDDALAEPRRRTVSRAAASR